MIAKRIERVCKEYWNIENYAEAANDETQLWEVHHRLEISDDGMHTIYTKNELKKVGIYYSRPAEELIFLTKSEHCKLHSNTIESRQWHTHCHAGCKHSESSKQKIKDALIGRKHTEETKKKMCEAWIKRKQRKNEQKEHNNSNTNNNCDSVALF